ncbi:unnamed protein product [Periconia digitata]|uniref:Uncharacterized protein n=1 Tax=Periconia digitata TaxID=1303443 RepID=A0A9W4XPA4_9PLEO|nr:unnamed protein product [Periconia digitata]
MYACLNSIPDCGDANMKKTRDGDVESSHLTPWPFFRKPGIDALRLVHEP